MEKDKKSIKEWLIQNRNNFSLKQMAGGMQTVLILAILLLLVCISTKDVTWQMIGLLLVTSVVSLFFCVILEVIKDLSVNNYTDEMIRRSNLWSLIMVSGVPTFCIEIVLDIVGCMLLLNYANPNAERLQTTIQKVIYLVVVAIFFILSSRMSKVLGEKLRKKYINKLTA